MCSVVGYVGSNLCKNFILDGLSRLEYRGYDSAGFACVDSVNNQLDYLKAEGKLTNLVDILDQSLMDGYVGIGHTRWSTHGIVSNRNAHPQVDCQKTLAIVHNGIIENHHKLRKELEETGHIFRSDTDTEVIAHFFESLLISYSNPKDALVNLVKHLEGAYAFIALSQDYPDQLFIVRKRSPICIGVGDDAMFVASDALAFGGKTDKVLFLPDESFAIIKKDSICLYNFAGEIIPLNIQHLNNAWSISDKGDYEMFMLKEIYEQKKSIQKSVSFYRELGSGIWDYLGVSSQYVKDLNSINIFGCGTSWHAARIAQFFFETICNIPVKVLLASEFRYMPVFSEKNDLFIAVSQSGETADTLEALRLINSLNHSSIVITNVASSTMVREAGGFLLTHAGPEIAVASTKAFSAQLTALYWLANRVALEKKLISPNQMQQAENDLLFCADILENTIENYKIDIINGLALKYSRFKKFIFLGRHITYPFAMEAALKLKEISYIFAQSYPAGELKHGPIALIDEETPIILFSTLDPIIYQKLLSNAYEVKARKGHLVTFAFEGQHELISLSDQVFVIPTVNPLLVPLAMTGLMQFFVYQIAKVLDRPIDKPRNLAKSVTVE